MSPIAGSSRFSQRARSFAAAAELENQKETRVDSKRMLAICDEAMKLPREQRRRFLVAACDGDEDLLTGALGILRAIDDSGSFLTLPESTWDDE